MLGDYKFKVGMRVRPSVEGIEALIFPGTRYFQTGIVTKVDEFNCPTVLWQGRKVARSYHPRFISRDYRRRKENTDA